MPSPLSLEDFARAGGERDGKQISWLRGSEPQWLASKGRIRALTDAPERLKMPHRGPAGSYDGESALLMFAK